MVDRVVAPTAISPQCTAYLGGERPSLSLVDLDLQHSDRTEIGSKGGLVCKFHHGRKTDKTLFGDVITNSLRSPSKPASRRWNSNCRSGCGNSSERTDPPHRNNPNCPSRNLI